ncbi:hypothetical protein [Treponema sp.]|uniref:hypothetical protein n=1 Tax=Treponema sp. TaxID=166 RepID=UPI00298E9632|nr:hypothetical protein [Treponema sp.]MCR5614390.1 hypothetical protein [Treponema sp.]
MVAIETVSQYIDVALEEEPVEILSPKVIELRSKIHDEDYMNNAIQRIAQVISKKLVENPEELKLSS